MKLKFREKIFVNKKNVTLCLWLITNFWLLFKFRIFKCPFFLRIFLFSQNIRSSLCLLVSVVWFVCFISELTVLTFHTVYSWEYFFFLFSVLFCLICFWLCRVFFCLFDFLFRVLFCVSFNFVWLVLSDLFDFLFRFSRILFFVWKSH